MESEYYLQFLKESAYWKESVYWMNSAKVF